MKIATIIIFLFVYAPCNMYGMETNRHGAKIPIVTAMWALPSDEKEQCETIAHKIVELWDMTFPDTLSYECSQSEYLQKIESVIHALDNLSLSIPQTKIHAAYIDICIKKSCFIALPWIMCFINTAGGYKYLHTFPLKGIQECIFPFINDILTWDISLKDRIINLLGILLFPPYAQNNNPLITIAERYNYFTKESENSQSEKRSNVLENSTYVLLSFLNYRGRKKNESPLIYAVTLCGQEKLFKEPGMSIVRLLLTHNNDKKEFDINAIDAVGNNALHYALTGTGPCPELIELLIHSGAAFFLNHVWFVKNKITKLHEEQKYCVTHISELEEKYQLTNTLMSMLGVLQKRLREIDLELITYENILQLLQNSTQK